MWGSDTQPGRKQNPHHTHATLSSQDSVHQNVTVTGPSAGSFRSELRHAMPASTARQPGSPAPAM